MLKEKIDEATDKLFYISESDAAVKLFTGGTVDSVTVDNLLREIGTRHKTGSVSESSPDNFFRSVTKVRTGASEAEIKYADRFRKLQQLLQANLRDIKVLTVGDDYQKDVYIVGLDTDSSLVGVQTRITET